jgi:hypothetical protein
VTEPFRGSVLEATLERITFANADTGYTVARVDMGHGGDLITVVGSLLGAQPGEALRMRGRWGSHPQFGRQFLVEDYTTVLPATVQGIRRHRQHRATTPGTRATRPSPGRTQPPPVINLADHQIRRRPILSGLTSEYQVAG